MQRLELGILHISISDYDIMVARAWSEPDFSFSELANMDPLSSDMLFSRKTSQNRYPGTDHTDHPIHPK